MNSVLEDDHLGKINLGDNKLNLRSRGLGTDRVLIFSHSLLICFLSHQVTSVLQRDDQSLLLVLHQRVSHKKGESALSYGF